MAHQKILAVAFALVVSSAHADNCMAAWDAGDQPNSPEPNTEKLKATLTNQYCDTATLKFGDRDTAQKCEICCEKIPNLCGTHALSCNDSEYKDRTKYAVAATPANYATKCCTKKKKCDIDCPAGLKDKANKNAEVCREAKCTELECCVADTTKCKFFTGTCDNTHYRDESKNGVSATSADFNKNCCTKRKKCDIKCEMGWKDRTNKNDIDCRTGTCETEECCEENKDMTKCMGFFWTGSPTCDSGKAMDINKAHVAATEATFKAKCCASKATCAEFAGLFVEASAASAKKTQVVCISLTSLLIAMAW